MKLLKRSIPLRAVTHSTKETKRKKDDSMVSKRTRAKNNGWRGKREGGLKLNIL